MGRVARRFHVAGAEPRAKGRDLPPHWSESAFQAVHGAHHQRIDGLTRYNARRGAISAKTTQPQQSPMRQYAEPATSDFVDLRDDGTDDAEPPNFRPKKRSHARMEEGHRVHVSTRQFKPAPRRPEVFARKARPQPGPPPHPIRVTPIQSRSPAPERMAIWAPTSPVACPAPSPPVTPVPPTQSPRADPDIATWLRKERQAFYVGAATSARASVKMDNPKPMLRPPIQPLGLYHLMQCGLLKFEAECSEFHVFEEELEGWKNDPAFIDRLFAAYGRFYSPKHQVYVLPSLQFQLVMFIYSMGQCGMYALKCRCMDNISKNSRHTKHFLLLVLLNLIVDITDF